MKQHTKLIDSEAELIQVVDELRQHRIICFDTEFIRESTFIPKLEIIQVATRDDAWLIDFSELSKIGGEVFAPLIRVFEDPDILKVLHAAQGDQESLYTSLGVLASPTLDTSIAASLLGFGDGVGLASLLKQVCGVTIKKGHARTNWSTRPLPEPLIHYALSDVIYLVELGEKLLEQLKELGREDWAYELCSEFEKASHYLLDPVAHASKLYKSGRVDRSSFSVLVELVKWRERRVRQVNVPRRRLADDGVLLDLARVKPKDQSHLLSFRGLNKGEVKNHAHEILSAIESGLETPIEPPPKAKHFQSASSDEQRCIDLIRCYVGWLADQNKIALKYVLKGDEFLHLLRAEPKTKESWVENGILTRRAAELVGSDLERFVDGKLSLSIDGKKLKSVPNSDS